MVIAFFVCFVVFFCLLFFAVDGSKINLTPLQTDLEVPVREFGEFGEFGAGLSSDTD